MKRRKGKIISSLKQFGGKAYLEKKIIPLMKYRPVFVEGFCATSIISLMLEEKFDRHVCIDKNPWIINFWLTLQREPDRLYKFLSNTEYSQENFERAKEHVRTHEDEPGDPFFDAAMYFCLNRMSRGADHKTFGWSDRLRRGLPEYISSFKSAVENLPQVAERIRQIEFYCGDFVDLCGSLDIYGSETVFYCDPPYVASTRVSRNAYGKYEMSNEEHLRLLDLLTNTSGVAYLSGYNSDLYKSRLSGYPVWDFEVANAASQKKQKPKMVETLWEISGGI